ncbi:MULTISPECIES: hypothetical protein [Legionellaceae]|uniref:hypothetical protein n=1 Tax=Legionellaceae TaxID=444 RepID=UPI000AF00652|nr:MULTISPECIES: hypothetical protein [Legionellaceae]MCK1859204.1 hypothetical protein [Legionella pneumophila]MCK1861973.1 hypothetical protein [Legionella pneumophila]MCW8385047.1 hypothetical protein [Fluoribacter dumoffii]MCW8473428.1 hypothetical protein [Legionella pneumophila]MCW8480918.1 hypothetical protein [Legionella pneumophila]
MVITKRKFFFFFQRKARRPRHNTINANSNTIVKVLTPIIIYPYLTIEVLMLLVPMPSITTKTSLVTAFRMRFCRGGFSAGH